MKNFLDKDFLLTNEVAKQLYHEHAELLPIIDYHCHLNPREIAENKPFRSLTELWLGGDHYKWRALRANGVAEKYITGKETNDWEKFEKWAATVPYTMRNPLYHWTHLELKTAFGIEELLNPTTARSIYDRVNEMLTQPEFTPRGLMKHYHVETVCTTDDPVDSLEYHAAIAASDFSVKVLPAWRPDKAMTVTSAAEYNNYVDKLAAASGIDINSFDKLVDALQNRHDFFTSRGCCLADHGTGPFPSAEYTDAEIRNIFDMVRSGHELSTEEKMKYQTALLFLLSKMNAKANWVQQFHFGPLRNTNSVMFKSIGVDTGFDTIGGSNNCEAIARMLDRLYADGALAKTILYNINPVENDMLAAMAGNFQDGTIPGKIQYGAAWWFNDQADGIVRQLNSLSNQGLLSRFVGMLTDSRSFLSYPRHEYFRRLLCNLLGTDVEKGWLPVLEMERINGMVEDICYNNAKRYLNL